MKTFLLPPSGQFFKANLHSHTNCSDGRLSPAEVKNVYKAMGYSIVAYTDHNIMLSHAELNDKDFLALNGYEIDVTEPPKDDMDEWKICHFCLIALEPDNLKQVCYHRSAYLHVGSTRKYEHLLQYDPDEPDYVRHYTPECISDMMKRGREAGFFVTYNHPTWSCESYPQYINYHNMHAMEIMGFCHISSGYSEYNGRVYDDMLRAGKHIYCIAGDDNHNFHTPGTRKWDSGGAWTMIKADRLDYRTITKALEDGHFYASEGPEIHALWVEDNRIHIETSAVEKIDFMYGTRTSNCLWAEEGESITEASAPIAPRNRYVRIIVKDHRGRQAFTNAYFIPAEQ